MKKIRKVSFFTGLGICMLAVTVFAAQMIPLSSINFPPGFNLRSPYYRIVAQAQMSAADPGFLIFHVAANFAEFDVQGLLPFKKLLHEIEVIERLKQDSAAGGVVDGAVDSVKSTGQGFVNLVSHPVDSVKGVGTAVGVLGRKIKGFFGSKEEGEKEGFKESILGSNKRAIAAKWGVDVYTSDPYMQEVLNRVAKQQLVGQGAVMAATFFVPVGMVVSVTMTVSDINASADQLVNDKDRGDLFYDNKKALQALGFSDQQINQFLNLPYYTPRESTYIRFYLEALKRVNGYRDILKAAAESKSLWQARKILYAAEILADADEKTKYQRIRIFDEGIAADSGNAVIFFTPYDYLDVSPLGNQVSSRVGEARKLFGRQSAEIRNAGKITSSYASSVAVHGIRTRDWVMFKE